MDSEQIQVKNVYFYIKRILGIILLISLACVFFYSAYTKSGIKFQGFKIVPNQNAFDNFHWTFLDLGINNILVSGIIARLMIGLEILLGFFLLSHIYLKAFTYKAIIAVLTIFIIYLIILLIKQGNNGNCGCFGNEIAMKPMAAIWKNVIMIAAVVLLYFIYPIKPYKHQEWLCFPIASVALSLPFLFNHVYTETGPEKCGNPINMELLYRYSPAPTEDLRTGKHIVSFMSLTCPHCKKAAYLLQVIKHEHPEIPIFMVLNGNEIFQKQFFDETHAQNLPYILYKHSPEFDTLLDAGLLKGETSGVPAIYWINNNVIEYKSTYYELDPTHILSWLKTNKP